MTLVLASASATRQKLLRAAGVTFDVSAADLDEAGLIADLLAKGDAPAAIAPVLAEQKAIAVSRRLPGRLVLGGDTVLLFEGAVISKCADLAALKALLLRLSGQSHALVSAAALARDGQLVWSHKDSARLTMRVLMPAFLETYLAQTGEAVLSSVGGYHYEGLGAQLFERVQGDYFTVLGLPLLPVLAALRSEGILTA